MSNLQIFPEQDSSNPRLSTDDPAAIAEALADIGVRFERRPTYALPDDADQEAILRTYSPDIAELQARHGYRSFDVIRLTPDHPDLEPLRRKFLSEHSHSEDEVRFFVEGEGLFTLHAGDDVRALLCTRGDLISVPAGMRHWFDMGPRPRFTAIRLFTDPEGWVAQFTGDPIADRFPRHEPADA